ncbi:MAG TPA: tripartite tricarboxylate transporter substrate binding protein [Burkholderiales bacterium]|nr:tripartite tricarboxylate transporter substrate binding protein [Burkholderiales bacterium]
MKPLYLVAASSILVLHSAFAVAQAVPGGRPVRVIVPVAPGGPSDTAARLIIPKLSEGLKETLVVDNRPAANGVAGTDIAAKSAPDGYTLIVGNSGSQAINAALYRKLPYDPLRDFTPIVQIVTSGLVLVANPTVPGNSLADFLAAAKKRPGELNVAVAGATGELSGDALWFLTGVKASNVRYKGSSPSVIAVVAGEAQLSMLTPLAVAQHVASGRLKAFGISSAQRNPVLPNVPTIAEQGVKGYDFPIWHGLFAPKGVPAKMVHAINREAVRALQTPDLRDRFAKLGFVVIGNTPEEFSAFVRQEIGKYRKIVKESGIELL